MFTWFFALGGLTPAGKQYCEVAKVVVRTALKHISFKPHFLHEGNDNFFTRWLGGREIPVTSSGGTYQELRELWPGHLNEAG